MLRVAIYCIYL